MANLIMILRIMAIVGALSAPVLPLLATGCILAVAIGIVVVGLNWRQLNGKDALPIPQTRNPTELRAAVVRRALLEG